MIEKLEDSYLGILEALDAEMDDPNFSGTPLRSAKALKDLLAYNDDTKRKQAIKELFTKKFPNDGRNGSPVCQSMVLIPNINSISMCPHHLLPVEYTSHVAYIPSECGVLGLSKIIRLVRILSARPVLQEALVEEIADSFCNHHNGLHPKGVMVVISGRHGCMRMRGVKCDSPVTMSAVRGGFNTNPETRQEFFELLKLSR